MQIKLVLGKETDSGVDPTIDVQIDTAAPLSIGTHRLQLIVEDDSGNRSDPAFADIIVKSTVKPNAHIVPTSLAAEFGKGFTLSGKDSAPGPGGKITKYIWTLLT
jgi:hypothetical protein